MLASMLEIANLLTAPLNLRGPEHSRDVLLGLAEFFGEVFRRGFAGDLDERELLAVARGVARSLAHAVLVIFLHQVR